MGQAIPAFIDTMQAADWEAAREPSSDPIDKKRPRHNWDRYDRLLLCLLYKCYDNTVREYAAVFNHLREDSLRREGFCSGMPSTSLSTQWHDMRIGSNGNDIWRMIHIEQTLAKCHIRYAKVRREIEDAACVLGLELYSCVQSPEVAATLGKRAPRSEPVGGLLSDVASAAEDTEQEEERPSPLPRPSAAKETPCLLFRFSNDTSAAKGPFLKDTTGFIAGSFASNPSTIAPVPTELLGALALIHLSPDQRVSQTPFVSFFSSILPPVQRALRSSSKAYVTIIDAQIAERYLKKRLGEGEQGIYSVYKLVADFDLKLRNNYTGPTEFLVYGAVPPEAIVGILNINDIVESSINNRDFNDVLQLEVIKRAKYAGGLGVKLKRSAWPLLFATGQVIGRLLSFGDVPAEYVEVLARKIACSWNFAGSEAGKNTRQYKDYINGVYVAYGRGHAQSISLEDQDEEDQDLLDEGVDDAEYPRDPDGLEAFGHFGTAKNPMSIPTTAKSFEDDQDLIDRQLEADCPELAVNHSDSGEIDPTAEPPSPGVVSSLDPNYEEAFEVAGQGSTASRVAHVGDWGGSPWRSITPLQPRGAFQTAIVTGSNGFFIDLTSDTEDDNIDDAGGV